MNDRYAWMDLDELSTLPAGVRSYQLYMVAYALAHTDRECLRSKLIDACHSNGLIRDDGMAAVEKTIDSAFRAADRDS